MEGRGGLHLHCRGVRLAFESLGSRWRRAGLTDGGIVLYATVNNGSGILRRQKTNSMNADGNAKT